MVSGEQLLDSKLAHVVAVMLGIVGAVAMFTGAATIDAFWFWIIYGIVWFTFFDLFEEDKSLMEELFGTSWGQKEEEEEKEKEPAVEAEPEEDPVTVLKRRYAEGSMDDDEFEARLETLLETPDTLRELERERA